MRPKKILAQHFLKCRWVVSTLIKSAAVNSADTIVEVGPGWGVITKELAQVTKEVVAIEKDQKLAADLEKSLANSGFKNVHVVKGDFIKTWENGPSKLGLKNKQFKVVANIPYYLSSRLLRLLLDNNDRPSTVALTLPLELAKRVVAKPPHMNLLALSVQVFGKAEIIKTVPKECFYPQPKIDSCIVKISEISSRFFEENHLESNAFFHVLRSAFSHKRKTLLNTLTKLGTSKERVALVLEHLKIKKARPEELSKEKWVELVKALTV